MNMRNIGVIISREYMTRVRKKSFLVITFVVPLLFAVICILPTVIMMNTKDKTQTVEVVDESGIVLPYLESGKTIEYVDCSGADMEALKSSLIEDGANAVLHISPLDSLAKMVTVEVYSTKPMTVEAKESIRGRVEEAVEDYRYASYDIPELKKLVEDAKVDINVATYTIGEDGREKITSSEVFMVVSMVMTIIIYMFVAMFSGMVMSSVIEEKSSKVVEVLVSSVKSTELMFGKIIGVACVALTQFFLWVVLLVAIVAGVGAFGGFDALAGADPEQAGQMAQMAGVDPAMMESISSSASDSSQVVAIFATLRDLSYGQIIFAFVAYFLLGYLLYASLFAAIGSAVDNEADTTQLQMPVTVPLLLAFFIGLYAFNAPDSQLAFWGSIIPLTSPIVMIARIPFGVASWELILSIVLLLLTFIAMAYVSAKIYKVGLLMSGKKTTFKDLWKWLRQN